MITIRSFYFFSFVVIFLLSVLGTGVYFYLRYRYRERYPYGRWEDLLRRLGPLDHDHLALIAEDRGDLADKDVFQPWNKDDVWRVLGGMRGLEVMEKNCAVLVDLSFYVQQWYPEALLVTEELRLDARRIGWHVARLRLEAKSPSQTSEVADHLKHVIAMYYQMMCEVLSLYEQGNVPGLADLRRAL
jgi:hypothetical protein